MPGRSEAPERQPRERLARRPRMRQWSVLLPTTERAVARDHSLVVPQQFRLDVTGYPDVPRGATNVDTGAFLRLIRGPELPAAGSGDAPCCPRRRTVFTRAVLAAT